MDTKNIIANIDNNRALIDAQVKRLSELGSRGPVVPSAMADTDGAADLLASCITANLTAAAEALQALAETETQLRSKLGDARREPSVIDVMPRVVE